MDQIRQESTYPPTVSRVPSTGWGQSGAGQSLNGVPAASKPAHMNPLPGIMVLLSILLTFSFVVLILSMLAGLQIGNTLLRPSPFSSFEAVWPGQSIASLSAYARQTAQGYLPCIASAPPHRDYLGLEVQVAASAYSAVGQAIKCTDYPKDGFFRALSVTIENNRIQQLEVYSDVLREDVLLLYWGIPDSIMQSGNSPMVKLSWERSTYSALASVVKPESVVKLITLTAREIY